MDVYGYNMFPHHKSDEIAKQMYAQQAFSPFQFNRGGNEPHNMPAPSGAPWNVQSVSWGLNTPPQLVQFTATPSTSGTIQCKRKSLDVEPVIPAKQLITEEKMAAHLNGLHISSNYTDYSSATSESSMEYTPVTASTSTTSVKDKLKGHKLVLADELKKLRDEPLLPAALIERLEKPCMSLMVWKPKDEILNPKTDKDEEESDTMDPNPRRSGVLVLELNNNNNSNNNNNNANFMDMEM